jgi:hypothetical protein
MTHVSAMRYVETMHHVDRDNMRGGVPIETLLGECHLKK